MPAGEADMERRDAGPMRTPEPGGATYATTILADGAVCPIHETLGRRVLRHIPADSREGRRLLRAGRVRVLVKDGRLFRDVPIAEVFGLLAADLDRAAEEAEPQRREELRLLLEALERQRRAFS
jgi:hypothetical protein